mgnify:CR=1 FL=1
MPSNWSKGFTKENNLSVRKRSDTMKQKKLDNFSRWRDEMKQIGKIPSIYPALIKDGDLAELIGVTLGDGHIRSFPRTEELSIFSNSSNKGFVKRYSKIIEKVFNKQPAITRHGKEVNCTRIRIYQKYIQKRLQIPYSPRGALTIKVPPWVLRDNKFIVRYLRGLYEAEGSFCVHKPTSTYKLFFSNKNPSMLQNVFSLMKKLGFHPHRSKNNYSIQLSRKEEVLTAIKLLKFRKY